MPKELKSKQDNLGFGRSPSFQNQEAISKLFAQIWFNFIFSPADLAVALLTCAIPKNRNAVDEMMEEASKVEHGLVS